MNQYELMPSAEISSESGVVKLYITEYNLNDRSL